MGWALVAVSLVARARASLPPAVGNSLFAPDELSPAFSVPVFAGPAANGTATLTVNPTRPLGEQPLPLVVMAVNRSDPWSNVMLSNEASIDDFLLRAPTDVHYLFGGRTSVEAEAAAVATALFSRLAALADELGPTRVAAWGEHLHFLNGTVGAVGGALADVLASWASPVNTLVFDGAKTVRRLDGHYGWCAWPDEVQAAALVDGGAGCVGLGDLPACADVGGGCDFVLLALNGSCTPEHAAQVAEAAGFGGVVLGQAPGQALVEVGADATVDAMPLVVTMVDAAAAAALAAATAAAANLSLPITLNYTVVPGIFASVDASGLLQQVGWEKLPQLMMLGWAGHYLNYLATLRARMAAPALVVPILDHAVMKTTAQASVVLPVGLEALRAAGLNKLEVGFHLDCVGARDEDCSVWDHCLTLTATCLDPTAATAVGGGGGSGGSLGEVGGTANEVWRGITAFRRRSGRWLTDISPFAPLLFASTTGSGAGPNCTFEMQVGGETWVASDLHLRFSSEAPGALPFATTHCEWPNPSTSFKGPDYNANRTIAVDVPAGTTRVQVAAIITGHSGCEFVPTSHHFVVNGHDHNTSAIAWDRFMQAGSDDGCTDFVPTGSVPNEHGTWMYGRNGWCDGADVPPLVWDVTDAVAGRATFNLTYYALAYDVGGKHPTEDGCNGGILMTANVAFYDD